MASRAREKCIIFSSITAADIPPDTEVRGTRMLRSLLHFAETGKLGAGTFTGGGSGWPVRKSVARVIREAGFHVHSQVGVSSFRIDLGVVNPTRLGEYIVGVECDGATYHSARSARDRDRLRQEVLTGLGWRLHRVWSTDWFRNPARETEKLLNAIRAADAPRDRPEAQAAPDDQELIEHQAPVDLEPVETDGDAETSELNGGVLDEVHYKECALSVPFRRGLLDLPVSELSRLSLNVVEAEGPIHTEEVARRVREAFGLGRSGTNFQSCPR